MKIDIREILLKKYYIPKSSSSLSSSKDIYHAVGYFDFIEVNQVKYDEDMHPWKLSYEESYRINGKFHNDCFIQEIKAFTNITEDETKGFSEESIKQFWDKDSYLLCMSMIHLTSGVSVDEVLLHIKNIMKEMTYVYYFTYDYSSIILFAKDICIEDYLERMFSLNYNNKEHPKIVKDSFSIYGFQKKVLLDVDKNFETRTNILKKDSHKYEIAVNISICDYTKYENWKKKLKEFEENSGYNSEEKYLAGRHDVSIVNKNADLYWLLKVHCILDDYSKDENSAFYTYETFIKISRENSYQDQLKTDVAFYDKAKKQLEVLYTNFSNLAKKRGYITYIIPVREVCNSVLSILKNGFAEDFVLCMYQPFINFLIYLQKKLEEEIELQNKKMEISNNEFDRCFSAFLSGLNSLVNSSMHTDRQFIQATSFGAIFYDIPPKIMAFYIAMIHNFCDVMKKGDMNQYTLFMTPGFSDEIHVDSISYRTNSPEDRVFQIFIDESFLYHPEAVFRRLVHEIAHVEGDELRNRSIRKGKIIKTYVYEILRNCLPEFLENYMELADAFLEKISLMDKFSIEKNYYSSDYEFLWREILLAIEMNSVYEILVIDYLNKRIDNVTKDLTYLSKQLNWDNSEEILCNFGIKKNNLNSKIETAIQKKALVELIKDDIFEKINNYIKSNTDEYDPYMENFARSLISLYSETYADMQMILVLNYSYESYLCGFIKDEKLDYKEIEKQNEDISRIAVVTKLMKENDIWDCEKTWNQTSDFGKEMNDFHNIIQQFIEKMSTPEDAYYIQNEFLLEYLQQCFTMSQHHYAYSEYTDETLPYKVKDKLETIRNDIQIVIKHDDVTEVYGTIDRVISEYKEFLKVQTIGEEN